MKRILRFFGWIVLVLIGLFLLLGFSLQLTAVQNFVVGKVTASLSNMLGTEVRIGRVDFDFFNELTIDEIYLEDQNRDTLAAIDHLSADISVFSLLNQTLYLDNIELNELTVNISTSTQDSLFNFDFILRAFAADSTTTAPADSVGAAPWDIQLGTVAMTDINFSFRDSVQQLYLNTSISKVDLELDHFDPADQQLNLQSFRITEPVVIVNMTSLERPPGNEPLVYPYTGWNLMANELKVQDGSIRYWVNNAPRLENQFDVNHLDMEDIVLEVEDFSWDTTAMELSLLNLAGSDHSGLEIEQAALDFRMAPSEMVIENLSIVTPHSLIQNATYLQFKNWNAFADFLQEVRIESTFDNSTLALADYELFIPYIPEEYRIAEPINLSGTITLVNTNAQLNAINLQMGDLLDFRASGTVGQVATPQNLQYDFSIEQLEVDYQRLRKELPVLALPSMLDSLGHLRVSGQLTGDLNQVKMQNLTLDTDRYTRFKTDGQVTNLQQPDNLRFDLDIDSLRTRAEDLAYFSPSTLPPGLYEMGLINYAGKLSGRLNEFYTKGKLSTSIGSLETNLGISFNTDYSDATYDGKIQLNEFELGKFLQDTTMYGKTSLVLNLEGQGLALENLNGKVNTIIEHLSFRGYDYQRIKINGAINEMQFRGEASMEDPNLTFDFDGLVNLNEDIPVFEFETNIDTVNLGALNLSSDSIRLSARLESNFRGNNIDDFLGSAVIKDFYASNLGENFHLDSLVVRATETENERKELRIQSDLLVAAFAGDFRLMDLPLLLENYINDYFPIENFLSPVDAPDSLALEPFPQDDLPDQNMQFAIRLYEPTRITSLFSDVLTRLDSAVLVGQINTLEKSLAADLSIPIVEAAGWTMDSIGLIATGDVKLLQLDFDMVKLSNGATTLFDNRITTKLGDRQLSTDISFNNPERKSAFIWGGQLQSSGENYTLKMNDTLSVDQTIWETSKNHNILFRKNYLSIKDFFISKNKQTLGIVSYDRASDLDYTPVAVDFKDFKLSEISSLTNIEGFDFAGLLNGSVILNDLTENLHYLADLIVEDFMVNDSLIGQIDITAEQMSDRPVIDIGVRLSGQGNEMAASGTYNIQTNNIQLDADIKKIPLILIDPFTQGAIKNSEGYVIGAIKVKGSVEQPDVNGFIQFQDGTTTIDYLQTRYTIPKGQINISNDRFTFENMQLLDAKQNAASLTGYVGHNYFETFQFNLDFRTSRFNFLNTKAGDNELFYGRLNLSADVKIRGTLEIPEINIVARTLEDSKLFVSAIVEEQVNQGMDYIVYAEPGNIPLDSLLENQANAAFSTPKIDLLLNLNLTPSAELVVIVDPITGDQLSCKGNANLTVEMFPTGEINILGVYTAVSGSYQFSYQNLVKRPFTLQAGSTLNFVGDPLDTRFDITAIYNTRTSVYPLIGNESNLSEIDQRLAKDRTDVNVLLSMSGNLDRPELEFDIQLGEEVSSGINSAVTQKLSRLREDEAELNKQVFGLLLLNSFVAEQSATAGLTTAGENIALSSVSSLISNQLNRLSERYLDGVGLTFDLESYRAQLGDSGDLSTRTNLNVGLSRSILNDRLTVKVGGVVQVDNGGAANSSGFSNIAGDFVLEYQLDKSGNYILRVFQRSDYDAFDDANSSRTGAGISFKKSFGQ